MNKGTETLLRITTYIVGILLIVMVIWQIAGSVRRHGADRPSKPDVDAVSTSAANVHPLPPPDDMLDTVYYVNTKSDKYHMRKCPIALTAADAYITPSDITMQTRFRKCPYCLGGHSDGPSQEQADDAEYQTAKTRLMLSGDPDNLQMIKDMTKQQEDAAKRGR